MNRIAEWLRKQKEAEIVLGEDGLDRYRSGFMSGFGCFGRDVIVLTAHHQNSKRLLSPHAGAFFSGFLNKHRASCSDNLSILRGDTTIGFIIGESGWFLLLTQSARLRSLSVGHGACVLDSSESFVMTKARDLSLSGPVLFSHFL